MGFEDLSNAGLFLGLGYGGTLENRYKSRNHQQQNRCFEVDRSSPMAIPETSLTLGLSGYTCKASKKIDMNRAYDELRRQSSAQSTVTSFSNANHDITSTKRERDVGSEGVELERLSSRVSDDDDEGSVRKKLRLTKEQSALLEDNFKEHCTLNPKQKQGLAMQLNLRPRQVEVWFQNRRARTKLRQTEVDCEFLKRCCETLKEENRRLQKELRELKTLKFASPVYMHVPAATLTMCPSCERIGGASNNSSKGPFAVAPKSHQIYNPFSHHPSAAC